eukprot:TRINITY_DN777952_c0_g1_i1.p1 TRINITY_DN777952_c0_g1~~TRINITY_DN777952_c0_g1_i1.p1  ORF type:complete len:419 (-),score=70.25 TRINITY_DN777952_c0_g1_i1:406-1662(-)
MRILSLEEIVKHTPYAKDNEYILCGYRHVSSWKTALFSVFRLHNESLNVWTHLFGGFLFITLMIHAVFLYSPDIISQPTMEMEFCSNQAELFTNQGRHTYHMFNVLTDSSAKAFNLRNSYEYNIFNLKFLAKQILNNCDDKMDGVSKSLQHFIHNGEKLFEEVHWDDLIDAADEKMQIAIKKLKETGESILEKGGSILEKGETILEETQWDQVVEVGMWPAIIFLSSATICLLFSSTFHLMNVVSEVANNMLAKMDYAGIALLICGSTVPMITWLFYCNQGYIYFYLGVNVFFCIVSLVASFLPVFQTPKFRPIRAACYVASGLFAGIPMFHSAFLLGLDDESISLVFSKVVGMGAFYIGGAALYALRIPERFAPGRFDYFFSSHQIFHVAVVLAALLHYSTVFSLYSYRRTSSFCGI